MIHTTETTATHIFNQAGEEVNSNDIHDILVEGGLDWTVSKRPLCTSYSPVSSSQDMRRPKSLTNYGPKSMQETITQLKTSIKNNDMENAKNIIDQIDNPDHKILPVEDHYAIVRNDLNICLGVAGRGYKVMDNYECLAMIENLIENNILKIKRVKHFDNGAQVMVMTEMIDNIEIAGQLIKQRINLIWSHDGSWKFSACFFYELVDMNCIINPKINKKDIPNNVSIRHTLKSIDRLQEAKNLMHYQYKHNEEFQSIANKMVNQYCDEEQFIEVLDDIFPVKEKKSGKLNKNSEIQNDIQNIFKDCPANIENTSWGALVSISEYADNKMGTRVHGKNEMSENKIQEAEESNKLKSIVDGPSAKIKDKAWKALTKELF